MKRLLILISSLAIQLSVEGATHTNWPFIVIRHTWAINEAPEVFAKLMESHYRYRGACDDFWFCTDGRLDSVTILNLSIGETDELKVRVRRPVSTSVQMQTPKMSMPQKLSCEKGANKDEFVVTLDSIPGWQAVTLFFI